MKRLSIKIQVKKKIHSADIDLPENWDEVPADLFPHLASLYMATDKQMGEYDKLVRTFALLTWKHWKVIEQLTDQELFDLLPLVKWVHEQLDLTRNYLPVITIDKVNYHGLKDEMENIRFGEWCTASYHASLVPDDETLESLAALAACLYRPVGDGNEYNPAAPDYRGDVRERFNGQLISDRTATFLKLERQVLQGIYVWFCSCRFQILNSYDELKSGADKPGSGQDDGWLAIYDDLRGDPKFTPAEKLEEEFLHTILYSLNRNAIKMAELKVKYKL